MLAQIEQVANKSFDYVVIGGGLTGLVVATRLSEDPAVSVLVLEAGEAHFDDPIILAPSRATAQFQNEHYDWNYKTTSQAGLGGIPIPWPRGKGLGGSSAMNFVQFHLPARSDIDAFETLGNKGWNWDLLRPYYKKCETFVPPRSNVDIVKFNTDDHGKEGPIFTSYPDDWSNLEMPYMEAFKFFGIDRLQEPFSGDTKGTWITPVTVDPTTGSRSYAGNAYYEPNSDRPNMYVLTEAQVIRVEIVSAEKSSTMIATSVVFLYKDNTSSVNVGKEVLLAAGAIGTPQILEMSGIGHEGSLSKAGVPVKHVLPGVGSNVQEHLMIATAFELLDDPEKNYQTIDCLRNPEELRRASEIYQTSRTGPLAAIPSCMAFTPLSAISPIYGELRSQLQASLEGAKAGGQYSRAVQKQHNIQLDHIDRSEPSCEHVIYGGVLPEMPTHQPEAGHKYGTIVCLINHPFSRGSIHISGSDPSTPPLIDPKYFEEDYDLRSMIESIKFARRLVRTGPLLNVFSGVELTPGPEYDSDEKIAEYIKKFVKTTYHTVGTCSMLPLEDDGVVDTNLKVYGTENIRIVDISVVPLQIGAHLQATAYALAELAADLIKGKVEI